MLRYRHSTAFHRRKYGYYNERLDRLRVLIEEPDFLQGKGLSNEVNIRIFCYAAEDEMVVRHFVNQIITDQSIAAHLVECDLYKIFISVCNDMDILEAIGEMETESGKDFLLEQLHSIATEDAFVQKIQYSPHKPGDVLLITGVGDVFPFMRVHAILEALQPFFSDIPILVMYPGEFDKHSLRLFGKLEPNSYYRAFDAV
jgi:hypothetical protein